MKEGLGRPHRVGTEFDHRIDFNENGEVEAFEIKKARRAGEVREPGEEPGAPGEYPVRTVISDGKVGREEFLESREVYLRPHPVIPDFHLDRKLDKNGDGFVDPEEIGIVAGFSAHGPIPYFEERVERLIWQKEIEPGSAGEEQPELKTAESTWQRKSVLNRDRRIAVVGLDTATNFYRKAPDLAMLFL